MQENNFEKQVQQKTDELKLNPSDEVWQRVAVAIAKKTKDRRIFAIILLLLVFISSAIFITWDRTGGKKANKSFSENSKPTKEKGISRGQPASTTHRINEAATNTKTGSKENDEHTKIKITEDIMPVKNRHDQEKTSLTISSKKTKTSFILNEPGNNNTITSKKTGSAPLHNSNKLKYKTKEELTLTVSNGDTGDSENEQAVPVTEEKLAIDNASPATSDRTAKEQIADTVSKGKSGIEKYITDTIEVAQKVIDKEQMPVKKSSQSKKQNTWKIGLNFSFGISATQNGYLGIIGSGNSEALKSFDSNPNQSTGGNSGQGAYIPHIPSKIKTGTGVTLGAFVQKNISAKTNLTLGLNYKGYNSSMMIGNRWDSISYLNFSSVFYRAGSTSKYKNHFHFIELPVAIGYKISKQNKAPIYLNAGLAVSRLIASNTLQFDTASGAYYKNNNLLNKTQVHISLGLLFSLSGKSGNPFLIGPDINYGVTKIAGSGLYGDRHYSYFGILAQKTIGKK